MAKKTKATGSNKTTALSKDQFDYIIDELVDKGDLRCAIICLILFQCTRINDVLQMLKVKDVYNKRTLSVKHEITFEQMKSRKRKDGVIVKKGKTKWIDAPGSSKLYREIFKAGHGWNDPLFYSLKRGTPFTDSGVKDVLSKFIGKRGIEQISPHSFRKAGARYLHFEKGVSIEVLCSLLDHESSKYTLTYLDIKERDVREAQRDLAV
jgi:site-specific recombinase XerD